MAAPVAALTLDIASRFRRSAQHEGRGICGEKSGKGLAAIARTIFGCKLRTPGFAVAHERRQHEGGGEKNRTRERTTCRYALTRNKISCWRRRRVRAAAVASRKSRISEAVQGPGGRWWLAERIKVSNEVQQVILVLGLPGRATGLSTQLFTASRGLRTNNPYPHTVHRVQSYIPSTIHWSVHRNHSRYGTGLRNPV